MTDETRTGRPLRLSQATLDSQRIAAERAARAGGVHADIGQLWTRKADGAVFRIMGRKVSVWALVDPITETVIEVGLDELVDDYAHSGCDHEAACCTEHRTHTSPHMGCILR